jgi:hypothetical protein
MGWQWCRSGETVAALLRALAWNRVQLIIACRHFQIPRFPAAVNVAASYIEEAWGRRRGPPLPQALT